MRALVMSVFLPVLGGCGAAMDEPRPEPGAWLAVANPGDLDLEPPKPLAVVEVVVERPDSDDAPRARMVIDGETIPWTPEWGRKLFIALPAGEHQLELEIAGASRTDRGRLAFAATPKCRLTLRAVANGATVVSDLRFEQALSCRGATPTAAIPAPAPVPATPRGDDPPAAERWLRERHQAAVKAVSYVGLAHGAAAEEESEDGPVACLASTLAELRAIEEAMREERDASGETLDDRLAAMRDLSSRAVELQARATTCG